MAVHRVVILGNKAMVVPPVLAVDRNDTVTFEARWCGGGYHIQRSRHAFWHSKSGGSSRYRQCGLKNAGQQGVYPYAVWCVGKPGHSASGNSDPIIIIKR